MNGLVLGMNGLWKVIKGSLWTFLRWNVKNSKHLFHIWFMLNFLQLGICHLSEMLQLKKVVFIEINSGP